MKSDDNFDIEWSENDMVEVLLNTPDDFLKVKETLTRIGVVNKRDKKLWQSCNILSKHGKYYIVHYKEMFGLDGKSVNFNTKDVLRRNKVISMLCDWGLIKLKNGDNFVFDDSEFIFVLKHAEKDDWELISKYTIRGTSSND